MAILATEKVLTLDYWKFAGDIKPGDILFDRHGNPVTVKLAQPYRALRCYEAQFNDGLTVAGDEHLKLPVETENFRKQVRKYQGKKKFRRQPDPTPLSLLIDKPLTGRENRKEFSVATTGALQLPHIDLPVPPFVFGFWFFNRRKDGTLKPPPEFRDVVIEKLKEYGYLPTEKERFTTSPTILSHLVPDVPYKIPNNYLLASPEQRLELFSGIMHTKSRRYNPKTNRFRFTSRRKDLAQQVQYLSESLGCKTVMEYDRTKNYYTVTITTRLKLIPNQNPRPIKVRQEWRLISDVYEIEPQSCIHIETDGQDKSFLVGEGFIPCL
jgi:replicative DNA helicase